MYVRCSSGKASSKNNFQYTSNAICFFELYRFVYEFADVLQVLNLSQQVLKLLVGEFKHPGFCFGCVGKVGIALECALE